MMIHRDMGVYVALMLHPDGATRRFLNDLPRHIGVPTEPDNFHLTAMYPEELARARLSVDEQERLHDATNAILAELGQMSIIGQRLRTVPNVLMPYKKMYGIEVVDDSGICNEVRAIGAKAIKEVTGVQLRTWLDSHHASVAWRQKGDGRRRPITYRRHFPTELMVSGVVATTQSVLCETDGQPTNYMNRVHRARISTTRPY